MTQLIIVNQVAAITSWNGRRRLRLAQILDLFAEDSWPNVYAGEREVRPPGAPTIKGHGTFGRVSSSS
jgi:hypothetical protein